MSSMLFTVTRKRHHRQQNKYEGNDLHQMHDHCWWRHIKNEIRKRNEGCNKNEKRNDIENTEERVHRKKRGSKKNSEEDIVRPADLWFRATP